LRHPSLEVHRVPVISIASPLLDKTTILIAFSGMALPALFRLSDAEGPQVSILFAQWYALNLSSATAHPEQVEAPERNKDQGARKQSQRQHNCFQHDRITLVSQKHARRSRNCHPAVPAKRAHETIFRSRRNDPETKGCVAGCQQNRDGQHAVLL